MTDAQPIIDTATRAAGPTPLDPDLSPIVAFSVPQGGGVQILDLEQYLGEPRRAKGRVELFAAESLGRYVNAHREPGTALYADILEHRIVVLLNGHQPVPAPDAVTAADAPALPPPGWGDHRATFSTRETIEWRTWTNADGEMFDQQAFAEYLEDNAADIVSPPAADLMELAKTFEATTGANFRSAIRLDNGQRQFLYSETIQASAGENNSITIPEMIELGLAPYEGADKFSLKARFRYRINGGALRLGFKLDRPDRVIDAAFADTIKAVETETGLTVFRGTPPA